jgi:hypothetical protein
MDYAFHIAHWVFFFISFAAISAYMFALGAHLDPDDPANKVNNTWVKINWGAASFVAALAILTVVLGVIHQKKLKLKAKAAAPAAAAPVAPQQYVAMPVASAPPAAPAP